MADANYTLKAIYKNLRDILKAADIYGAEIESREIIKVRTGFDISDIVTNPEILLSQDQVIKIQEDAIKRLMGMPLSRIYGVGEFYGQKYQLSKETLDPRSDTEVIIEIAKQKFINNQPESILDLGTGTGCILVSLLREFTNSFGFGTDISFDALRTAQINAVHNKVSSRAFFLCGDWMDSIVKKFDLIVSNPPYISNDVIPTLDNEVINYDPILALSGGKDGLQAYRKILSSLEVCLSSDGIALFEIGYDQGETVPRLVEEYGFSVLAIHHDLAGRPRVVEISSGDK